jgi:porin
VLVPAEISWHPKLFGGWLEGSYKFGAWYSSGQQPDVANDNFGVPFVLSGGPPATRQGLYGAYFSFQQQVIRTSREDPNRGLRVFLNAAVADMATATTDRQIAAGFWYTGPFPSRPNDFIGFAVGTTRQNPAVTQAAIASNALGSGPVPVKDAEYVFELDYNFVPMSGVQFRPNLQYIYSPGGSVINKDVWVLGLKTVISF